MNPWEHDHAFRQDERKPGELRTLIVVVLSAATMVLEIVAGIACGSMALLADGLHMASHAAALTISMAAYIYARRRARDHRFSFGTGKVNSLAGYTGAVLLAMFALMMVWESFERLFHPLTIAFNQALLVAFVGLAVNGLSVFVLDYKPAPGHEEDDDEAHKHAHDHNLRSAYFHVLADTLTSVLAIVALLAGKYFGLNWLDPIMGVVGAMVVAKWSAGLISTSTHMLLDRQGPVEIRDLIRRNIEDRGGEIVDLHLWAIGPGIYALILSVVSDCPKPLRQYRDSIAGTRGLVHVTIELWSRHESASAADHATQDPRVAPPASNRDSSGHDP